MPFLIYSALRIALIVVVGVALYLVGMRGWLLGVVAILVALLVSYLALSRQREAAALYIATRRTQRQSSGVRLNERLDRDNADEDDAIDASTPTPDLTAGDPSHGRGRTTPAETGATDTAATVPQASGAADGTVAPGTAEDARLGSDRETDPEK